MNNPLISVIIPVFNGEEYIAQCLENILYQTYKNIEIVVVNDGSTDDSEKIAQLYPVKIITQKNCGVSVARNTGLNAAEGEYIHFMDIDDLINLEFYEKMIDATLLTNADMSCCSVINYIPRRTSVFQHRLLLHTPEDKFSITNVARQGYVWRYLFKKSFLQESKLKFDVGELGEDTPFSMLAVYFANKIVTVPDAVYYYKKREGSICHSNDRNVKRKRHEGWVKVKEFRLKFAEEHNIKIPGIRTGKFSRFIDKWFA